MAVTDIKVSHVFVTPVDFTIHTNGDPSPSSDLLQFYIRAPWTDNTVMKLRLCTSASPSIVDRYETDVVVLNKEQLGKQGLGSIAGVEDHIQELLSLNRFTSLSDLQKVNNAISEKRWVTNNDEWQLISLPKSTFFKANDGNLASIAFMQFVFLRISVGGNIDITNISIVGGGKDNAGAISTVGNGNAGNGGMYGTYKYRATFFSSATGNRSNPGESVQVAKNVERGYVSLSGLPTTADTQVDKVEIWRTVGDGVRYFKVADVDNGVTTFDDEVADASLLDDTEGIATLQNIELPLDNDRPHDTFDGVIIDKLAAFWIDSVEGSRGRVYFSPLGRPESLKGFISVSQSGDPIHKLILHKGLRYAITESKVYRIDGDDPYTSREIGGVPGVAFAQRRTAVSTPVGILYNATDGIRLFDGTSARLVTPDAMSKIFRGEASENMTAFEGIEATFARDEYIITDGTQTLAFNINNASWREMGFNDVTALFYEWDTDTILSGRTSNTQLLEVEGIFTDYNGQAIAFEWETPAVDFPNDEVQIIERVFIDADANSTTVTPTIVHRLGTEALATFAGAARTTYEREVQQMFLKPSMRFTGSASAQVTLYDAEFEMRPLVMGINLTNGGRTTITGRYREELSTNGDIVFTIPPPTKDFDGTDRLFIIDRMTIEMDSAVAVTPSIILAGSTIALTPITTTGREVVEIDVGRFGRIEEVNLEGPFFSVGTPAQIYRVELHLTELVLGVTNVTTQRRLTEGGRLNSSLAQLEFEILGDRAELDGSNAIPLITAMHFDVNTNGVPVDVKLETSTETVFLNTISNTGREVVFFSINRCGFIRSVKLVGDFTTPIEVYGVELSMRNLPLGINFIGN